MDTITKELLDRFLDSKPGHLFNHEAARAIVIQLGRIATRLEGNGSFPAEAGERPVEIDPYQAIADEAGHTREEVVAAINKIGIAVLSTTIKNEYGHSFSEGSGVCNNCSGSDENETMPTYCPGAPMTAKEMKAVKDGKKDFLPSGNVRKWTNV